MMKKIYGEDCLSRSRIHEWFKLFQEGREALEDDERSGRPRNVVNEENAEIVREFIRKEPKSSLKSMKSELGISAASIYRILTENLGYIKIWAKFVPHTLKPHEKYLRIFDHLTKNRIVTINRIRLVLHPAISTCAENFIGQWKENVMLTLMLFKRLNAIPKYDLKSHSIIFLIVEIVVFSAKGTISMQPIKYLQKKTNLLFFL